MKNLTDKLTITSWSLYDFANTIFSMNIISLYFALWVTVDKGGPDILYSVALSGSMLATALSVPLFGVISDNTGRRRGALILLTCLCCVTTATIGLIDELYLGLILFMVANYCYQSSMVFYNGMLPYISKNSNVGLVSGYGVSLGYMGSIVGLLAVRPIVEENGRSAAFLPTASMFLFFALPCFFFVKDPIIRSGSNVNFKKALTDLLETIHDMKRYQNLLKFICIHFLMLDVVNTIIAFMSIYAKKVIGFNDNEINSFMIFATSASMIGSLVMGWVVKTKGSKKSYWLVLMIWIITLFITAISQSESLFWVVGPLAGIGLGGVWVVSRSLLVELSPPEKIGQFFGLYGLAGKMASIVGPLLWGTIIVIFEKTQTFKYRVAITLLLLITLVAARLYWFLTRDLARTPN